MDTIATKLQSAAVHVDTLAPQAIREKSTLLGYY
jgi:hypothetical protein